MKKKIIVAIADGVGDRPNVELGGLTPLQYAKTPHLDQLAKEGMTGIMDLISPGITVGTDMGHLILFGNPSVNYPGRGPMEAAGVGMDLQPGDVAFRCNFATRGDNNIVIDRRAGRIRERTNELAEIINGLQIEDVTFLFKEATEHRAVLVMRGEGLSAKVTDTDPKAPNDGHPFKAALPKDDSPEAAKTARILNEFLEVIYPLMDQHDVNVERRANGQLPANFVITRGAGQFSVIDRLGEQFGYKAAVVAGEDTVLGVGRLSGYDVYKEDSFTGNMDTNVRRKAEKALEMIQDHDLVYVHLKVTDVKGHDNKPFEKAKGIELFDEMVGILMENRPENTLIALCADHSTPCEKGEHSGEPVPIVISGTGIRRDKVEHYDEISCAEGAINRIKGREFVWTLLDYLEVVPKQGN